MAIATCIGCGCDDLHACVDGLGLPCYWLRVDYRASVGVCSSCPDHVCRWNRGDRTMHEADCGRNRGEL